LLGKQVVPFEEANDLAWHRAETLPAHPNGMRYTAYASDGAVLLQRIFYSIGGGFIRAEGAEVSAGASVKVPHPFHSAAGLLEIAQRNHLSIWEVMLANESVERSEAAVQAGIHAIWQTM